MSSPPWFAHYDAGVSHHLEYPDMLVYGFLDAAAQLSPQRTCLIFREQKYTYQEIATLTDRLAARLIEMGVEKGERVGILMPNSAEFVIAYFAILKAGAIVVATNPLYTPPEIVYQVNDANVMTIFCTAALYTRLKSAQPQTHLTRVILVGESPLTSGDLRFADLLTIPFPPLNTKYSSAASGRSGIFGCPGISSSDLAIFQYTGGTTGISKAAMATHHNLVANTIQFKAWMSTLEEEKETFLLALPVYHIYAMVCGMLLGLALRATLVIIPDPRDIADLLSAIQNYRVTYFPAAPTLYNAINSSAVVAAGSVDLTSIKACISGSAALLEPTKQKFESLTGGRIIEGYGLSEAPTATHCNPLRGDNRFGSIGLPLPDVDAKIVSLQDGESEMPVGQVGELIIRSPQVMLGYHNKPAETALSLREGWLYTGDIARMDADGYFYIVDRKKDIIKPGGMEVWPREVEEALAAHPDVAEVAVAGVPDAYRGETVKAWVVVKSNSGISESDLQAWCRQRLAPFKIPTRIEFLPALPKSAIGKVLKRILTEGKS